MNQANRAANVARKMEREAEALRMMADDALRVACTKRSRPRREWQDDWDNARALDREATIAERNARRAKLAAGF